MKTLNVNKILLLISLFLISAVFSTAADASCRYTAAGLLDVQSGSQQYQVYETAVGRYSDACSDTPDEYELTFYKLGICTATSAANDLSSCQYIVNDAAGVNHVIVAGTTGAMAIPEFAIDPGTYTHMVVVISNKLGVKHSFTATNSLTGASSSTGTSCWTSVAGPSAYTNEPITTPHGDTIEDGIQLISCGAAADSAPIFSYEVINKLTGERCSSTWLANGDRYQVVDEDDNVATVGNGTAEVSLLKSTDVFATACTDAAKILWTTTLTTPYVVTTESTWKLNMRTTDSVSIDFDSGVVDPDATPVVGSNNNIMKMGADPIQLFLTVTD